jgi:hypothetical protein
VGSAVEPGSAGEARMGTVKGSKAPIAG